MFGNFNTATLRWFLDILGLAALLLACFFHSWKMDGVGIAMLLTSHLMLPPGGLSGAIAGWFLYTFSFLVDEPDEDYPYGKKPWDLADSAYFKAAQAKHQAGTAEALTCEEQYGMFSRFEAVPVDFLARTFGPEEQRAYMEACEARAQYEACAYRVTPEGRPTHVRAWGDLH